MTVAPVTVLELKVLQPLVAAVLSSGINDFIEYKYLARPPIPNSVAADTALQQCLTSTEGFRRVTSSLRSARVRYAELVTRSVHHHVLRPSMASGR